MLDKSRSANYMAKNISVCVVASFLKYAQDDSILLLTIGLNVL